jgi:ceramide glucosyltransferase
MSILKPLHGIEPRLYENLCSFCHQDYPAFQLLFGVRDAADPALAVARRIQKEFPQLDITVDDDDHFHGCSNKEG